MAKKKLDHLVLAEGEVTGHKHQASGGVLYEEDDALKLEAETDIDISHEEHHRQALPPDIYRIGIVQEQDHFANAARNVAD